MIFRAFLDAIDRITILVDKSIVLKDNFILEYNGKNTQLEVETRYEEDTWYKYILIVKEILDMTQYIYVLNGDYRTLLVTGSFVRDTRFDEYYAYDGKLGMTYTPRATTFDVWTPVARSLVLELTTKNGQLISEEFKHYGRGHYSLTIKGDYEGSKYRFRVKIFEDEYKIVNDPYGIASDANGNFNYVVDPAKFKKFIYSKPSFSGHYVDSIIYEASIRDLTSKLAVKKPGTFKALCERTTTKNGKMTGLDYIASLGVTHLQLMPIFDFYGISDLNPKRYYNWGYNPLAYFVPKGAFSTDPNDPYKRINELIELIDLCHAYGLLVNMDVVFNHVNDVAKFPFDLLVPGYYYRASNGFLTNVSGCGNDLATEKKMCSKFIVDNLIYMTKTYHFSGYRFDLMGLLDIPTLKKVELELRKLEPNIMLYGEGWNMPNTLPEELRPASINNKQLPSYAFFNDVFRDVIKGSQWGDHQGFITGKYVNPYDLTHILEGSSLDNYRFLNPNQSINYVECHDNYTVYDFLKANFKKIKERDVYIAIKLALSLVILAQGVPFIHCGQEFLRTKNGCENSYNAGDEINGVDWERKDSYDSMVQMVRDLIAIRKEYEVFRLDNPDEIRLRIKYLPEYSNETTYVYELKEKKCDLLIVLKNKKGRFDLKSPNAIMIFDGYKLLNTPIKKINLKDRGIYIYRRDKNDN